MVESEIGRGGAGTVYRARDAQGRIVALKILNEGDDDPDRAPRFLREGKLAASLSHPGIVSVVDVGEVGDVLYLAFEWVEGRTLIDVVADRSMSVERRVALLDAIAEAVAYAHEQHIVHRDLKPANVMLTGDDRPKLLDFGVAKRTVKPVDNFVTREDVLVGTLTYMAPEQMSSADVDARADQFAWGVIAYELLSGTHPRNTIRKGEAPFPFASPRPLSDVPPHVAEVVRRAMSRPKAERYGSMRELLSALRGAPPSRRAASIAPPRSSTSLFVYAAIAAMAIGVLGATLLMYLTGRL